MFLITFNQQFLLFSLDSIQFPNSGKANKIYGFGKVRNRKKLVIERTLNNISFYC